jgi:hypothetical protein
MEGNWKAASDRERGLKNAAQRAKTATRRELRGLIDVALRAEAARHEARRRAEAAKLEAERRAEFGGLATAQWRVSKNGNPWCVVDGRRCVIFRTKDGGWGGMIVDMGGGGERRLGGRFGSTAEVMRAMRDRLWPRDTSIQYGRGIAVARVVHE